MITGIISEDFDYLIYTLLKTGCYFQKQDSEKCSINNQNTEMIEDLNTWFQEI